MKPLHSNPRSRSTRSNKSKAPRPDSNVVIRKCEEAAAQMLAASEELMACWTALGIESSTGATTPELLRRRAWCNVLELRLREKTRQLEKARHEVDAIWDDIVSRARTRALAQRVHSQPAIENLFSKTWTLLMPSETKGATSASPLAVKQP